MPGAFSVTEVVAGIGMPSAAATVKVAVAPEGHVAPSTAFTASSLALPVAA